VAVGYGLARVLSKHGCCSRAQAEALIRAGRVRVGGRVCTDPERRTALDAADIEIDGVRIQRAAAVHIMLNKPRGLVCTRSDERGRATVYDCLRESDLPWLAPVGRLDQASEGLLLLGNDPAWAAAITDPDSHLVKTYHVQIDRPADDTLLAQLRDGVVDAGETLNLVDVHGLRSGGRTSWLEIRLDQGRNRQIRRMLAAHGVQVLRLVRVAIGDLRLGDLCKGSWRPLVAAEISALRSRCNIIRAHPSGAE
jgi:23S rRNA pseudouridine2605 synthase